MAATPDERKHLLSGERLESTAVSVVTTQNSKWRKGLAVVALWVAYLLCNMAYSSMSPFFPVEATSKGASFIMVGIIIGTAPLTVVIMSPLFGYLLPWVGIKVFIFFGLLLVGSAFASIGFTVLIPAWGFEVMTVIMGIIEGTGTAMFITATFSTFPTLYPDSVGTVVGLFEIAAGLGYALGPTFGGILYQVGGYRLPFAVIGGSISFFSVPCPLLIGSASPQNERHTLPLKFVRKLLTDVTFIALVITVALAYCSASFLGPTLQPFLVHTFHLHSVQIGFIIFIYSALYIVVMIPLGPLSDRVKKYKTFIFSVNGLLTIAFGYFVVAVPFLMGYLNVWFIRVMYVFIGIGAALGVISIYADMLRVSERYRSEDISKPAVSAFVSGMISSSINFGDFFGAFAGGIMGQYLTLPSIALVLGELVLSQGVFLAGVATIDIITR